MTPIDLPLGAIRRVADDSAFRKAVAELFAELDARIAELSAVCRNRGDCCRFGEYGHRLFVTGVELAYFLGMLGSVRPPKHGADSCPYQVDGRCTAREARPSGCRVFFCEPGSQEWQTELTEETLARLKELHVRFDLPYAYVDWLAGLAAVGSV